MCWRLLKIRQNNVILLGTGCSPDKEEVEQRSDEEDVADIRGGLQEVLQVGVP